MEPQHDLGNPDAGRGIGSLTPAQRAALDELRRAVDSLGPAGRRRLADYLAEQIEAEERNDDGKDTEDEDTGPPPDR